MEVNHGPTSMREIGYPSHRGDSDEKKVKGKNPS